MPPFWNPPHLIHIILLHFLSRGEHEIAAATSACAYQSLAQADRSSISPRVKDKMIPSGNKSSQQKILWKFSQVWFLNVIVATSTGLQQVTSHRGATIATGTSVRASPKLLEARSFSCRGFVADEPPLSPWHLREIHSGGHTKESKLRGLKRRWPVAHPRVWCTSISLRQLLCKQDLKESCGGGVHQRKTTLKFDNKTPKSMK